MINARHKFLIIDFIDKHGTDAEDKSKIYAELKKMIDNKPFDFSNTSLGSLIICEPNRIGHIVYEPEKVIDSKISHIENKTKTNKEMIHARDEHLKRLREYYVSSFSKMSIAQAIKVSESETIEFDRMIEFCNAEYYQKFTGEYWFPSGIFSFYYKKVFVSYSKRTISDEDGYNFKTLKELIDYVDSWF